MADDEFILKLKVDNSELKKAFKGFNIGGAMGGGGTKGKGAAGNRMGKLENKRLKDMDRHANSMEKLETRTRISMWNLITGRRGLYRSIGDLNQIFQENQGAFKENIWKFIKAPFGTKGGAIGDTGAMNVKGEPIAPPGGKGGKSGKGAHGAASAIAIVAVLLLMHKTLKKVSAGVRFLGDAQKSILGGVLDALVFGMIMFLSRIFEILGGIYEFFVGPLIDAFTWAKDRVVDVWEEADEAYEAGTTPEGLEAVGESIGQGIAEEGEVDEIGETPGTKAVDKSMRDPRLQEISDIGTSMRESWEQFAAGVDAWITRQGGAWDTYVSGIDALAAGLGPAMFNLGELYVEDLGGGMVTGLQDWWGGLEWPELPVFDMTDLNDMFSNDNFNLLGDSFMFGAHFDTEAIKRAGNAFMYGAHFDLEAMKRAGDAFMYGAHLDLEAMKDRGLALGGKVKDTILSVGGDLGRKIGEAFSGAVDLGTSVTGGGGSDGYVDDDVPLLGLL